MASKKIVIAFDLYGTLLSTASISKKLGEHFGHDKADHLAATWRKYQLEYTWRLNSMNQFMPFSEVTAHSLQGTLAENGITLDKDVKADMMKAYDSLSTFPDVGPALKKIWESRDITAVVFSNGTKSMVFNSVTKSPDLSPYSEVFSDIIVVEPTKRFKPTQEVYKFLAEQVGMQDNIGDLWLISGNPFDVVGARAVGMQAAWIDRTGAGWTDALIEGEKGRPTIIVKSLEEVVEAALKHTK